MEPLRSSIGSSKTTTLQRVEQNDSELDDLCVGNVPTQSSETEHYWPNNFAEWNRLVNAIGNNNHLDSISFRAVDELARLVTQHNEKEMPFFDGLGRNSSISSLQLVECDISHCMTRGILDQFSNRGNDKIRALTISFCDLSNERAPIVASVIQKISYLGVVYLENCDIDDNILFELIPALAEKKMIVGLNLDGNNIRRLGCKALATILQDQDCKLWYLSMKDSGPIDDDCAIFLADSLKDNKALGILHFSADRVTSRGWDAFSKTICDTSSVNATYTSNHNLTNIGSRTTVLRLEVELLSLLELNDCDNKEKVAIQKILRRHPHLDATPFIIAWDMKMLPLAIKWFDKASGYAESREDRINIDTRKLDTIYQFARTMPMDFVSALQRRGSKRKMVQL